MRYFISSGCSKSASLSVKLGGSEIQRTDTDKSGSLIKATDEKAGPSELITSPNSYLGCSYLPQIFGKHLDEKSRRAFLKTPGGFSGPKSYFMCRLFANRGSVFICFES